MILAKTVLTLLVTLFLVIIVSVTGVFMLDEALLIVVLLHSSFIISLLLTKK